MPPIDPPEPDPAPLTEAAGLLASGAIFPRRVGLWAHQPARPASDRGRADYLAGFKRGAFALYLGDEPILHFDPQGRWQRAFVAGVHYLKGLDTQVRAVDRVRVDDRLVLRRRVLASGEATRLDAQIAAWVKAVAAGVRQGDYTLLPPPSPAQSISVGELIATLDRIAAWDATAWADHLGRFRRAFGVDPLPCLPPDCPNPLILRPAASLAAIHLADHVQTVLDLLGERINQCRDIYLAGTGWVERPSHEVLDLLGAITERLPITPNQPRPRANALEGDAPRFETLTGAIDQPAAVLARNHPWAAFRMAHLGRVALSFATADASLAAVPPLVEQLKAADLGVGLMVTLSDSTTLGLLRLVTALPLTRGDLVTLMAAPGIDTDSSLTPLALNECKDRLAAQLPNPGPRVVVYNPDKQWL